MINPKTLGAEFIGTFWLVLGGCGSAVLAAAFPQLGIGLLGVSLAFGLTVLTMAYAVGHISGGHFNPAVSVGLWAGGRFPAAQLLPYIVAQVLGGLAAGAVLYAIASGKAGFDAAAGFASNGFGEHSPGGYSMQAALVCEVVMTALFLVVILGATDARAPQGFAPIAIGLCLTLIHLISIPVTNTSVNPARSTGVAVFQGSWALSQLWLFWVAPIVGALLGAGIHRALGRAPGRRLTVAVRHAMEAVATPADAGRALLERLLARHSPWPLAAPEPTPAQLDLVFDLALRAPDHGSLRPWRFAVVRGPAREALGEVFVQAARARDPQGDAERFRSKAMAAPLIIAMAARVRMGHKVPEAEQVMAVAAAAMNMLNALHLLGYGGFWATGANVRDDVVRRALGFGGSDRMVGFLYVGTPPPGSRPPQRPSREAHVREWVGPSAGRVERGLGVGGDLDNVRPR